MEIKSRTPRQGKLACSRNRSDHAVPADLLRAGLAAAVAIALIAVVALLDGRRPRSCRLRRPRCIHHPCRWVALAGWRTAVHGCLLPSSQPSSPSTTLLPQTVFWQAAPGAGRNSLVPRDRCRCNRRRWPCSRRRTPRCPPSGHRRTEQPGNARLARADPTILDLAVGAATVVAGVCVVALSVPRFAVTQDRRVHAGLAWRRQIQP